MKARRMGALVLGGIVAMALTGCGDSGGGSDGDTLADGADAVQSDVVVPGPGECELNWVTGFSPFIGVRPETWGSLEPSAPGTVFFGYKFVGGPGSLADIDVQTCRLVDGAFQFAATSEYDGEIYTLSIAAPNYPGVGNWQPGSTDGLEVRLELREVVGPTDPYLAASTDGTHCELCVDATGRQGAFRCDDLMEAGGDRGGISHAGFICPEGEPGFSP